MEYVQAVVGRVGDQKLTDLIRANVVRIEVQVYKAC